MMTTTFALVTALVAFGYWGMSFSLIPDLFRLNKERQEQGYYMAEFEFKMVGLAHLLDQGHYLEAAEKLRKLHHQMETKEGLIHVPKFATPEQEMDFYLSLQNPRTGAFMDDEYPYCTYEGPTGNVLEHLEELAARSGKPIQLKYPLRFLDRIAAPESLRTYLDEIGNIGWLASKLPETTFHMARDLLHYAGDHGVAERNSLYRFSPQWKNALRQWFLDNQDPESGFWGPRFRGNGRLAKVDLHNTGTILGAFVDEEGMDRDTGFQVGHRDRMIQTTLRIMGETPPELSDLEEWHGWNLRQSKGVQLLSRYLWKDASAEQKEQARERFERLIRVRIATLWIPTEGAFAYYPDSRHATLDGTGNALSAFDDMGSWSIRKRTRVWGSPESTIHDLGVVRTTRPGPIDLTPLEGFPRLNSVRFHAGAHSIPDSTGTVSVFYFKETPIPDFLEIAPSIGVWLDSTSQGMGNWVNRNEAWSRWRRAPHLSGSVYHDGVPWEELGRGLTDSGTVELIGYDALQVPICRLVLRKDG